MLIDAEAREAPPLAAARPFLKWAGGKRQLLPVLRRFVPPAYATYHEPFVGSGALFFDMWSRGRIVAARLADTNDVLVGCYAALRRDADAVIDVLERLAARHRRRGSAHYYEARARFNGSVARWRAGGAEAGTFGPERAALFIYLNRTGYNGLFRLNSRGEMNVPAGRYLNPRICDATALRAAAGALRTPGITLVHAPWEDVLDVARAGDFVYFDPPYAPLTATARFTSYTAAGFGDDDQRRLADAVVTLARRGCHVVLSNSTAPSVVELYESSRARDAGLRAWRVPARRAINADARKRGEVLELVVTNVAEQVGR
jgi:DNA adenine methylase